MKYDTCLITGGTGTLGSCYLMRAIRERWHKKIIIFSRDEYKQVKFCDFLKSHFAKEVIKSTQFSLTLKSCQIRFIIGDVRDYSRISLALHGVDLVIHSAALKHVPVCEYNIEEAIHTNIQGTLNVVKAAHHNNVKHLVSLSTDKAVDPVNLYGATKMCLEKIALNHRFMTSSSTTYSVVRYGNVMGSRGSLIEKLWKHKEAVSITDPQMTRFWITIETAIDLIRWSARLNLSGTILVPIMKSLTLGDTFSILRPDLSYNISGKRPGEKKHETILSQSDSSRAWANDQIIIIFPEEMQESPLFPSRRQEIIEDLNLKKVEGDAYSSDTVASFGPEEFKLALKSSIINLI